MIHINRFLPGKAALMGCPRFDDTQDILDKCVDVFGRGDIASVTVPSMEVPCCSGLLGMVTRAREVSGAEVPIRQVVLSTQGQVKGELDIAA